MLDVCIVQQLVRKAQENDYLFYCICYRIMRN